MHSLEFILYRNLLTDKEAGALAKTGAEMLVGDWPRIPVD